MKQVIWYALDQFAKDHLLQERLERPAGIGRLSRRELIQRIGLAASISVSCFCHCAYRICRSQLYAELHATN